MHGEIVSQERVPELGVAGGGVGAKAPALPRAPCGLATRNAVREQQQKQEIMKIHNIHMCTHAKNADGTLILREDINSCQCECQLCVPCAYVQTNCQTHI